jgi:hypothetical protein
VRSIRTGRTSEKADGITHRMLDQKLLLCSAGVQFN